MLSDHDIRLALETEQISVEPIDDLERRLQPASLDVRLGSQFLVPRRHRVEYIDPKVDSAHMWDERVVIDGDYFVLHPGEFILATTLETVRLDSWHAARIEGKSSVGRLGILVHGTAGFIDPGFHGQVTLEVFSVNQVPTRLYPGMPIGQLAFDELKAAARPYSGKYLGQVGPKASAYHKNWTGHW